MIFYATKETMQRYKLNTPEKLSPEIAPYARAVIQREQGNSLYEWGCKLFYVDGRKSLQVMHFASKLVIFLVDVKIKELEFAVDAIPQYLTDMYASDPRMLQALDRYFASSPIACFDKITDRSIIASMNAVQSRWAWDGRYFYRYIHDGIMQTRQINRDVNEMPVTRKVNGKEEWIIPYKRFAEVLKKHYL